MKIANPSKAFNIYNKHQQNQYGNTTTLQNTLQYYNFTCNN